MIPIEFALMGFLWCLFLGCVAGGWATHHDGYEAHRRNLRQHLRCNLVTTGALMGVHVLSRVWPP